MLALIPMMACGPDAAPSQADSASDPEPEAVDVAVSCDRSGVLIYGPTDLAGEALLAPMGLEITVWDAATWTAASSEDFAAFSLLIVGEQSCDGPDLHGELQPLIDTVETWTPAVDGRVLVSGFDLQCHITDFEHHMGGDEAVPPLLWTNAISWLTEGCATSVMFATDWGRREGAQLAGFGDFELIGRRGDAVTIRDPQHPLFAGIAPDGLDNWGSSFHSALISAPSDFDVVATGPSEVGVIVLRDALHVRRSKRSPARSSP